MIEAIEDEDLCKWWDLCHGFGKGIRSPSAIIETGTPNLLYFKARLVWFG